MNFLITLCGSHVLELFQGRMMLKPGENSSWALWCTPGILAWGRSYNRTVSTELLGVPSSQYPPPFPKDVPNVIEGPGAL